MRNLKQRLDKDRNLAKDFCTEARTLIFTLQQHKTNVATNDTMNSTILLTLCFQTSFVQLPSGY